jgi:cystinosin
MATGNVHPLDYIYFLSFLKLYISIAKYIPQVRDCHRSAQLWLDTESCTQAWLNRVRKSTVGWSIHNILLVSLHEPRNQIY